MKLDCTTIRNRARHHQDEAALGSPMFAVTEDVFDLLEALHDAQRARDSVCERFVTTRAQLDALQRLIFDPDVLAHYGQHIGTIPSAVQE